MRAPKPWVLLSVILLATACERDDENDGPVAIDGLCEAYHDALCDYLTACGYAELFALDRHESCEDWDLCLEADSLAALAQGVEESRLRYDSAAARECLSQVRSMSCATPLFLSEWIDEPFKCEGVFTALQDEGDACYLHEECVQATHCAASADRCPGICAPHRMLGARCSADAECGADVASCVSGLCTRHATEGEVCGFLDAPRCRPTLRCDFGREPTVCVLPGNAEDPCESDAGCDTRLGCQNRICVGPALLGEPCTVDFYDTDELFSVCEPGAFCDAGFFGTDRNGTCRWRKGAGSECSYFLECQPGLACIGASYDIGGEEITPGTCAEPLPLDGECTTFLSDPTICGIEAFCDLETSKCVAYPTAPGEPCDPWRGIDCVGRDLYCNAESASCAAKKDNEETCSEPAECRSGFCAAGRCTTRETCEP